MHYYASGVQGRIKESQWFIWNFHAAGEAFDFYFTNAASGFQYPANGFYSTNIDATFVQDGQVYSYIPAAIVSRGRRDYDPANMPTLFSPQLNQTRGYRVFLPRGYVENAPRRYPVLYMHDVQNVFDQGTFGTWAASTTLTNLQITEQMQEIIVTALDNVGDTR